MESFVVRVVKSSFFYWVIAAFAAVFYFISFDYKKYESLEGSLFLRIVGASKFKNLKLGIDLEGGTRLVLRADEDKIVASKLASVGKAIERALNYEGFSVVAKALGNKNNLQLTLSGSSDMAKALEIARKNLKDFIVSSVGSVLEISISKSEQTKLVELAIEKSVDILKNRLDTLDVRGLTVSRHGLTSVVVQLPGLDDISDIKDAISRAAKLDFRLVADHASSERALVDRYDGIIPSDKTILTSKDGDAYLVSLFPDVSGSSVVNAKAGYADNQGHVVAFELDAAGRREFREITKNNIGSRLAIVMDSNVISAPSIRSEIDGSGNITGVEQKEALRMAQLLRSGSLEAPLIVEQECSVGASLGTDSITQGFMACAIALLVLLLFSMLYYKTAGFLAALALAANILMILCLLALFKATLTLPGIAGIVLTVGMAIDASIIIFERIKEEIRQNKSSFRQAVETGFEDAMVVILDSNITTFIAGLVLFWFGGPAVKGFAVTLMIGIISTVMTGVYFLRSSFSFMTSVFKFDTIRM